ncbi:carboxypeptidase-like regulatory domain-containing protein [Saccharicrinis sp. 156]|uniref:carboxypeptidase-like regulatory domain-containing protein n=1 Tax=Saccharicrinis sp. 156 TaxID=3417574 RepID=UPI003D3489AE
MNKYVCYIDRGDYKQAFYSNDNALLNWTEYTVYLMEKACLLHKTGYKNEALKLYQQTVEFEISKKYVLREHIEDTGFVLNNRRQNVSVYNTKPKLKKRAKLSCIKILVRSVLVPVVFTLTSAVATAQSIEGYVRNTNGQGIENIELELAPQDDPIYTHSTNTDANGYYYIANIVTVIEETGMKEPMLKIIHNGTTIIAEFFSFKPVKNASLFSIDGRLLLQSKFMTMGKHIYRAEFNLTGIEGLVAILKVGDKSGVKLLLSPNTTSENTHISSALKDAQIDLRSYLFKLSDPNGIYQSQEYIKSVDTEAQNTFDFEMLNNYQKKVNLDATSSRSGKTPASFRGALLLNGDTLKLAKFTGDTGQLSYETTNATG